MRGFDIVEPSSLEETFGLLGTGDPAVRPMGGGTGLILMMKSELFKPTRLVSLRKLGDPFHALSESQDGKYLRIGALNTFSTLDHSPLVQRHFPVISETMKTLANLRVRNVASVGGNLAHGDPHLDLPPVWMSLDGEVRIVGAGGERTAAVADLFVGYYETILQEGELIAELRVPIKSGWRSSYTKVTTRAAHDWPAIGLAISMDLQGRQARDLRIVLSAALDKPTRLVAAEAVLKGRDLDEAALKAAAEAAIGEVELESDNRGSADYKTHLLQIYVKRALEALVNKGAAQ